MRYRYLFLSLAALLMVIPGCGWNVNNALSDETTTTTTYSGSGVAVSPTTVSVASGGTSAFSATVIGATDQGVVWSVVETNGGSITQGGVYTAPQTAGTYHVKATSTADTSLFATATVTITVSATQNQNPPLNPTLGNAIVKFAVQGIPSGTTIKRLSFVAFLPNGTTVLNQGVTVNYLLDGRVLVGLGDASGTNFFNSKFMSAPSVRVDMSHQTGFGNGDIVALYCTLPPDVTDTSGITINYIDAYSDLNRTQPINGTNVVPSGLIL